MPIFNFKKCFADAVERGEKRQTIRKLRRDGRPNAELGETLYLYTAMRTRYCRKLGEAVCTRAEPITIAVSDGVVWISLDDGQPLLFAPANDMARADGFDSAADLADFIEDTHGLPFEGTLIGWSDMSPSENK